MDNIKENADKLLSLNLVNIAKKLKSGRTLLPEERKQLESLKGEEKQSKLPAYTSMNQASSETGIPLAVLKAAKKQGCPAFKWSRFYLDLFLPWYFTSENKSSSNEFIDLATEKAREARARADVLELEKEQLEGTLVLKEAAQEVIAKKITPIVQQVKSLPSLSARCNPENPNSAREVLQEFANETGKLYRDS